MLLVSAVLSALLVGVAGKDAYSETANSYPVESKSAPLSMEVAFRGKGEPWEELPLANLMVGVKSLPQSAAARQAVRTTWMQLQSLSDPKLNRIQLGAKAGMVVRFIVGDTDDPATADSLQQEQDKYHDIVRVPLTQKRDDTLKMAGEFLKWAHVTYNYRWAFITKDDSFVRLDKLLLYLESLGTEKVYAGKLTTDEPVIRSLDSDTPHRTYKPYADPTGYALSHDVADFVVNNFERLKFPVLQTYGAESIAMGNWFSGTVVTPVNNDHIHPEFDGCDKSMLVQGGVDPDMMRETFINLVKGVPCHGHPFTPAASRTSE